MSNKKSEQSKSQPIGIMLRQARVRSISFETVTAPEVLTSKAWNPRLEFKMSLGNSSLLNDSDKNIDSKQAGSEYYKGMLEVEVIARVPLAEGVELSDETEEQQKNSRIFVVKVTQEGIFNLINLTGNKKDLVLNTLCLETLFPYLSTRVSETVLHAGYQPIYLQPMNFSQVYKQKLAQEKEQLEQQSQAS